MLVRAVAGVEYRNTAGELGRQTRLALLQVAHDDGIDMVLMTEMVSARVSFAQRGVAAV